MARLHMGCGGQLWGVVPGLHDGENDWINVDSHVGAGDWAQSPKALELVDGFPRVFDHDMTHPLPFPDNFATGLFTCHALEHVPTAAVPGILAEWRRVLQPGAEAVIVVPDLLGIARKIVETGGDLDWSKKGEESGDWAGGYTKLLTGLYGDQSGPGMLHMTGFTPLTLERLCRRAGFAAVRTREVWDHEIFSIETTATKGI